MNPLVEFQKKHGANVRAFLASEDGRAFTHILAALRPKALAAHGVLEHQIVAKYGEIAGYEACLSNMFSACSETLETKPPEQNYGVHPKVPDQTAE